MQKNVTLEAQKRSSRLTKGELNRFRQEDKIPAVIYGREKEPVPVFLDGKEFRQVLSTEAGANVVIDLNLTNGQSSSSASETVMIKDIQRDILVQDRLLHVDLIRISLTEKRSVNVPVDYVGEPVGVKEGGVVQVLIREVEVSCLPTAIPDQLEMDISELEIGENLTAKDLSLPEGVELEEDPDETLVSILTPVTEEEIEGEEEEEGAEEEASETEETEAPGEDEES